MIFIVNKYTRFYFSIIENAKARTLPKTEYREKHHIVPRSLGGNDDPKNLVDLTAREHFVCHKLLIKMTEGAFRGKMAFALVIMSGKRGSRIYGSTKKLLSEYASEFNKGKKPITDGKITKFLYKNQDMPIGFTYGWDDEYLKRKQGNNKGKIYITDGINCRSLLPNEMIPTGWYKGQSYSMVEKNRQSNTGENNAMSGRQFISNGISNKTISVGDAIPVGWYKGKIEKKSDKKSISKKGNKNPNFGKVSRNAISIEIDGSVYNSAAEAQRAGYSRRTVENIYKRIKNVRMFNIR